MVVSSLSYVNLYSLARLLALYRMTKTIYVVKTMALISYVITQVICAFAFVYAKSRFSHDSRRNKLHI